MLPLMPLPLLLLLLLPLKYLCRYSAAAVRF